MSGGSPTLGQLKAQVAAIRQRKPDAKVIGIRTPSRWTGVGEARDGAQTYVIRQCDSPLAMRVALREPVAPEATKILITPLDDCDLAEDILLRLAKRRLWPIDSWQIVRTLFQARGVDPRLTRQAWIAEWLLEQASTEGYPAARGGFLDVDTVWTVMLEREVGLTADPPDLTTLLKWSLEGERTARFREAGKEFQQGAIEWLAERAGPVATLVLETTLRLDRPDAVALGLLLGVVYHPEAVGKLDRAIGKLEERYLGGATPAPRLLERWSAAATEVVRGLRHTEPRLQLQILSRADDLLGELDAQGHARLSATSHLGFTQRLAELGLRLSDLVTRRAWGERQPLHDALQRVRDHDNARIESRRLERAEMAVRLVRWLAERAGQRPAASLGEAADQHLHDGGFVDWARFSLAHGDQVRELSEAYAKLGEAVWGERERDSERFAQLLAEATALGSMPENVVPVERILAEVVAPLAAHGGVLVIVIDGLSVAVCRQLLAETTRHEWIPLSEPGRRSNRAGLAVLPSKTEFSRTSLLVGRLQQGGQAEEQAGFANHPELRAQSRAGFPPVLFHKVDLQEATDNMLAPEVRDQIASSQRRVVGVVVNAVDDHLLKGDQLAIDWSPEHIKVLRALLHEARLVRRQVILVSDHGHVLDHRTQARLAEGGERWRLADSPPAADELQVSGMRVMTPGKKLIAPWSERVRYSVKKNGYHGGLNPQEMVVPVIVLSCTNEPPGEWQEQADEIPGWWDEPTPDRGGEVRPASAMATAARPAVTAKKRGVLFDMEAEEAAAAGARGAAQGGATGGSQARGAGAGESGAGSGAEKVALPGWVEQLLRSPVLEQQKKLAGRHVPSDAELVRILTILDGRGGKLTTRALARLVNLHEIRLTGLLAKLIRVLNIDGYAVLEVENASDTVELNVALLRKQFELGEG